MSMRSDDSGLESIPLKLMIVAVVATMSVLPAAQALTGLETREFARRADLQLDMIVTTAQVLTVQGPGNVRTLALDFTTDAQLGLHELRVGDRIKSPNSSSVILVLNNGAVMGRVASDPPCALCSRNMATLIVRQPDFDLRMVAVLENRTTVVLVELV